MNQGRIAGKFFLALAAWVFLGAAIYFFPRLQSEKKDLVDEVLSEIDASEIVNELDPALVEELREQYAASSDSEEE